MKSKLSIDSSRMASPATPKLASTLLSFELEQQKVRAEARGFNIGIKSLDQRLSHRLWTGGKLMGVVEEDGLSVSQSSGKSSSLADSPCSSVKRSSARIFYPPRRGLSENLTPA